MLNLTHFYPQTPQQNTLTNKPQVCHIIAQSHHLFAQNINHYFDYFAHFLFDASVTYSLHSYVTESLALCLPPFPPSFPSSSAHCCGSQSFAISTHPPSHNQQIPAATIKEFSADARESLEIPQDKLYNTLDMHVFGLKYISWCLTILWWRNNSNNSNLFFPYSSVPRIHIYVFIIFYFKWFTTLNYCHM